MEPEVTKCCQIPKGWGGEKIIYNDEKYCGKVLWFLAGCKFSMHYHVLKQETWYIHSGDFIYRWIDTEKGEQKEMMLKAGDVVTQYPGMPHQLEAITGGEIFEVSTEHFDSDSYRIWRGD